MTFADSVDRLLRRLGQTEEGRLGLSEPYTALLRIGSTRIMIRNGKRAPENGKYVPDVTVITDRKTWQSLMSGRISPTDAWFSGSLKLPGASANQPPYVWFISLLRIFQGRYFWR